MVIALLVPVILARSMGLNSIVEDQSTAWYILLAPIAALVFLVSSIAELGRAPFDINEAESEIVAGFHIEYSGMKFGLFYAGELLHALTVSALFSTLFLGGWQGPFADRIPILGVVYLFVKAFFIYWVIMWIKYSFPRLRIDQMLGFSWKFLTPLSLVLVIATAIVDKLLRGPGNGEITLGYILIQLGVNVVIAIGILVTLRAYARVERKRFAADRPVGRASEADFKELVVQE
jgi:NADH-quinone oxidoreductase subunit H